MENETPTWLRIMQNGSIGEARTKAFLLDRFWILERSVDIDGADFIIQRRVTQQNLLDRDPPRFGVVQVKFFETVATTHYIPKVYVLDEENNPRDEFFLICHTGLEDEPKTFFFAAKTIFQDFPITIINDVEKFRLPGSLILNSAKYKVDSKKYTLDRIEHQLALADFTKNRKFLSWRLPSSRIDTSAILPEFKEPIDNWWGEIPKEFKNLKEKAYSTMIRIEEIYELFRNLSEEMDPIKASEYLDDIRYQCRDGFGRWSISLPNDLLDEDFETVCRQHLDKVTTLKSLGLLDKYINIKKTLRNEISNFIIKNLPINSNTVHSFIVNFSVIDFTIKSIDHKLISAEKYWLIPKILDKFGHIELDHSKYSGIKDISKGKFEYFWLPSRIYINDNDKKDIANYYRTNDFSIYHECMDKMYNDRE